MKNSLTDRRIVAFLATSIFLLSACSKSDNKPADPSNPSATCKDRPALIGYGRDSFEIQYNAQDKPIKIITTINTLNAQGPASLKTTYTLEYNAQGRPAKLSRSINATLDKYYLLDYNGNGQLIKQTEYDRQGTSHVATTADYSSNGMLIKITTHTDTLTSDASSEYEYANGNLVKKTVKNLYDKDTRGFYDADFTYAYYQDQEIKIQPFFAGLLGLQFIADYAGRGSLQYLPDGGNPQLLYMQETATSKNFLKNIEVIAYRYNTSDTTHINYEYEYDKDGLPTLQKGGSTHIIRRSEPTPFGAPIIIETPYNTSFTKTMYYSCQ